MKVTESRFKNRQLHIEDYLQMVSAEQKEYEVPFSSDEMLILMTLLNEYLMQK